MHIPDPSRRTVIALVAVIAGIVIITLALLGTMGSDGDAAGGSGNRAINPVAPIDPRDQGATERQERTDPLDDVGNPFASSFGDKGPRTVTVRVSASGPVAIGIRYRDGRKSVQAASGAFSVTRTVKGGSPLALVGIRLGPQTNRGTCTILVDGVEVSSHSAREPFAVTICLG